MNIGGNDIVDNCGVSEIVSYIEHIVNILISNGVKHVHASSILERGSFLNWTGTTRKRFNKIRRSVNETIRRGIYKHVQK